MFFYQKNKLNFGPSDEDPEQLADKLQAIVNLACGNFESEEEGPKGRSKTIMWKLSDHYDSSAVSIDVDAKIKKSYKALEKRKEDKNKILEKIAMKYKIEADDPEIDDNDSEFSSDLYMATEEDDFLFEDEHAVLNKDKNYFGKKAKDRFWKLYKSNRTFKDTDKNNITDPILSYLKICNDNHMLPKAGMMIRSEKTSNLSFANFGLLQKNCIAVAEALKRYPLDIESLDFTGNGIRDKEFILLVESLEPHLLSLQSLNFSDNRIGYDGAVALAEKLSKMKHLESLNLNGNQLGDDAATEIVKSLSGLLSLKSISLSNNALGHRVIDSEFISNLSVILKNTHTLTHLDLSWNNLRGEAAENLILAFAENFTVK